MIKTLDYVSPERIDYQIDNFYLFLEKVKFDYKISSIHVAGTNGKGTTTCYLSNIYSDAGYKVGLYQSPYFSYLNESILINNKPVNDESIIKIINEYKKLFIKYGLSLFEIETFIAFKIFENEGCDIAIIECGMGGEYDATNIFTPVCSVITSVSIEHTDFLGTSLSEIAKHKSGIIKELVPVVIGKLPNECVNVISQVAKINKSQVIEVGEASNIGKNEKESIFSYKKYSNLKLSSRANYSLINALSAIEVVDVLNNHFPINEINLRNGLYKSKISCRFETISEHPFVILDGAHNPEAIEKLKETLLSEYSGINIHILFACFNDKNISSMLTNLNVVSNDIILTTFDHPRARDKESYFLYLDEYRYEDDAFEAFKVLCEKNSNDLILITGSLAFCYYMKDKIMKERK